MTAKHTHSTRTYEIPAAELLGKLGLGPDDTDMGPAVLTHIKVDTVGETVELTLGKYHGNQQV